MQRSMSPQLTPVKQNEWARCYAEQVEVAARAQFAVRPTGIRFVFNQYLVEDGERRILIDTGPDGSLGQTGQLPETLAARGIRRDQIDAVIVTHMHQDQAD